MILRAASASVSDSASSRKADRLAAVTSLRAHVEACSLEHLLEVEPDDRLVLGDEDPEGGHATIVDSAAWVHAAPRVPRAGCSGSGRRAATPAGTSARA